MKTYEVRIQSRMGGEYVEIIANITSISFSGSDYIFWNKNNCILSVEKEYMIEFYPVSEN